jgi:thiamine-phosphate pyrophosphorylase
MSSRAPLMTTAPIHGVYAIVDPEALGGRQPLAVAAAALDAGISVIQLRAKKLSAADTLALARAIRELCARRHALLIVNDRLDVALAASASGVHLGQDDLPLAAARAVAGPGFIIGVSTHSLAEARAAQAGGADYIGFGAMYATATKTGVTPPQGLGRLREIVAAVGIPVVAIGGVTPERLPELKAAGAAAAAVISALCAAEGPGDAAHRMVDIWRKS